MQLHFNSKQWYFVKIHAVLRINFDQMKIRSFYNMVSKWDETSWNLLRQIRARLVVTNARFGFICSFRILCEIHWKSLYTLVTVMVNGAGLLLQQQSKYRISSIFMLYGNARNLSRQAVKQCVNLITISFVQCRYWNLIYSA